MTEQQFLIGVKLDADDQPFIYLCLLALYRQQVEDEQQSHSTKHTNGMGFNKSDAPFLTKCAHKLIQQQPLSVHERKWVAASLKKYAAQLTQLIDTNKIYE